MSDFVIKMRRMIRVKNLKNTWHVLCVEIIVSVKEI